MELILLIKHYLCLMIDQATIQKIFDAADILEVVSDFVSLKKRG